MIRKYLLYVVCMALAITGCGENNPVLQIEGGLIKGVKTQTKGVYVYRGIPYAAPPLGDFRWKEPQPVTAWTNFAKTGNPGLSWEPYTKENPRYMIFKLDESGRNASAMGDPIDGTYVFHRTPFD